ncbi:MAG: class I SAM-dependent methyltransferase [Chitinophagaceae bacterium]
MTDNEVGKFWNENTEAWTTLTRAGFDTYRNYLNTPAFFEILPDIADLKGIDIGCGEGYNTRLLAQRKATMSGIDISDKLIEKAKSTEYDFPLGIEYLCASATALPFESNIYDFATSFMCLMDVPNVEKALSEGYRILKPNGFFQFSIPHPCFNTPHRKNLRDENGRTYAIEVANYYFNQNGAIDEWIFSDAPEDLKNLFPKFKIPTFNRTLSQWFKAILDAGFIIEKVNEPYPGNEIIKEYPSLQNAQIVAYFLHVRCRKC